MPDGSGTDDTGDNGTASDPTWEIPETSGGAEDPTDLSWEIPESDGGGGDDGWQTSNETPPGSGSGTQEDSTQGTTSGGQANDAASSKDTDGNGSSDSELENALKDMDGEILAERDIIRTAGNGTETAQGGAGLAGTITDAPAQQGSEGEGDTQIGGPLPPQRRMPQVPTPPSQNSGPVPADIADARDDDIIARQLREAAMQEQDPELREKLWEEYRKYKRG